MKRKIFFFSSLSIIMSIAVIIGIALSFTSLKIWYYKNMFNTYFSAPEVAKLFKNDFFPERKKHYSPLLYAPNQKVPYFMYISDMISNTNFLEEDASEYDINNQLEVNKLLLEQLEDAKIIDPDNAFYNYCRAYIYATEALVLKSHSEEEQEKHNEIKEEEKRSQKVINFNFNYKDDYLYKLVNEKKLNKAIEEYKKGLTKPFYKNQNFSYVENMIGKHNFSVNNFYDFSNVSKLRAECIMPNINFLRKNIQAVGFYAKLQYSKKNIKEAENILNSVNAFVKQRQKDSRCIIDGLVEFAFIGGISKNLVQLYHNLNDKKQEQKAQEFYKRALQSKNSIISNENQRKLYDTILKKHSALFTSFPITALKMNLSEKELIEKLQPERVIGAKLIEKMMINVIFVVFCVLFLMLFIAYLIQFKRKKLSYRIVVPNMKEMLYIIIGVFILPTGIYLFASNYELMTNKMAFSYHYCLENKFQALLFLTTLLYPTFSIVKIIVRRYCRTHNIEYPKKLSTISIFNYLLYGIILMFSTPLIWKFIHDPANQNNEAHNASQTEYLVKLTQYRPTIIFIVVLITIFMLIMLISNLIFFLHNKDNKYRQLLFCNYLFYAGLFSLLITGIIYSTTNEIETYYFNKDEIIFIKDKNGVLTNIELEQLKDLNNAVKSLIK